MKKLLISTLTALTLVGMVGCTHEVTIKIETPTIETETKKETENETETQEEIQEITEEPCVEEPVETYQETQEYIETEENVQYEYNPDWRYDQVFECQYEILPDGSCRYYKIDNETGKYYIVENPEPVDCGIVEKYEPEGYQPIITYYLEPEYIESNENFVYDSVVDCYVEKSQTINEYGTYTNYYKLDETNGKYKKIPSPYNNIYN